MSEEQKKPRPLAEVQQDYSNVCAKAGNVQYQIYALQKDLETINKTLLELNFEAAAAHRAEEEAKKAGAQ